MFKKLKAKIEMEDNIGNYGAKSEHKCESEDDIRSSDATEDNTRTDDNENVEQNSADDDNAVENSEQSETNDMPIQANEELQRLRNELIAVNNINATLEERLKQLKHDFNLAKNELDIAREQVMTLQLWICVRIIVLFCVNLMLL